MTGKSASPELVLTFSDETFQSSVLDGSKEKPVLVDFFATWCGPCKAQAPIVEELAKEWKGRAVIGKLDVDDNPESAQKYGVMGIPALKVFKNGQVVEEFTGLQQRETLTEALARHS